jgi:hypothetical protein
MKKPSPPAARKPKRPPPAPLPPDILDRAVILLCSGRSEETAAARLAEDVDLTPARAARAVELALAAIVRAAAFDRDREIGRAYYRLTHIYHATVDGEANIALAAQRELNKLLGLYTSAAATTAEPTAADDAREGRLETAIRGYIVPLGLAPTDAPLTEHVRLLAARFIDAPDKATG